MNGDEDLCDNLQYVGPFHLRTMRALGTRTPNARYNTEVTDEHAAVPLAILGSRVFEGRIEYEVEFDGQDRTSWVNGDNLDCPDLLEEYLHSG